MAATSFTIAAKSFTTASPVPVGPLASGAVRFLLVAFALIVAGTASAAQAPTDTLVLVNGDPIRVSDLDTMVMESHQTGNMQDQAVGLVERLLNKRVNDYLLIQDAMIAGIDEDPVLIATLDESRAKYAIQVFVRDNLALPESAPPDSVRAYFERYYWRIRVRQLSVRTEDEARRLRDAVLAGADMDSLARAVSLDTKKLKGGLYNLLYWADLENRIRDQVRTLNVGEISPIFPYNEAFAFVRVEERLPVHEEAFAKFRPRATSEVHGVLRQRAWDAFADQWQSAANIQENLGAMASIIADSGVVLRGEFLKEQPELALRITDDEGVTGTKLRKTISHEAMQNALAPFHVHLTAARKQLSRQLALEHVAREQGYFEHPEVVTKVDKEWEQGMIEIYLNDTVAAKIRFNREEFQEFYDENIERFRGPEEVRLDVLILDNREDAEQASQRLNDGADFGYIFKQYNPNQEVTPGAAKFIKITELSSSFGDPLEHMEVGQSSEVVEMPMGFMVFRLDAKRPGSVPPIEAVDMDIRRVLYQRKFNERLDAHLELLKEGSEIKRWPDRIAAYYEPVEEGQ